MKKNEFSGGFLSLAFAAAVAGCGLNYTGGAGAVYAHEMPRDAVDSLRAHGSVSVFRLGPDGPAYSGLVSISGPLPWEGSVLSGRHGPHPLSSPIFSLDVPLTGMSSPGLQVFGVSGISPLYRLSGRSSARDFRNCVDQEIGNDAGRRPAPVWPPLTLKCF